MSDPIFAAIFGLFSALIGGSISALFTSRLERERFKRDTKRQLYGEFVESIWVRCAPEGEYTKEEILRSNRKFSELATKILIYCSPDVANCLRPVLVRSSYMEAEDRQAWQRLILAMRRDVGEEAENLADAVDDVVFNRVPGPNVAQATQPAEVSAEEASSSERD